MTVLTSTRLYRLCGIHILLLFWKFLSISFPLSFFAILNRPLYGYFTCQCLPLISIECERKRCVCCGVDFYEFRLENIFASQWIEMIEVCSDCYSFPRHITSFTRSQNIILSPFCSRCFHSTSRKKIKISFAWTALIKRENRKLFENSVSCRSFYDNLKRTLDWKSNKAIKLPYPQCRTNAGGCCPLHTFLLSPFIENEKEQKKNTGENEINGVQ